MKLQELITELNQIQRELIPHFNADNTLLISKACNGLCKVIESLLEADSLEFKNKIKSWEKIDAEYKRKLMTSAADDVFRMHEEYSRQLHEHFA